MSLQIFLYLFFINNLFITSSLIIGSGAVIHALTGLPSEQPKQSDTLQSCQKASTEPAKLLNFRVHCLLILLLV